MQPVLDAELARHSEWGPPEARRFLRFVAADADSHDVRFIPVE